MKRLYTIIFSIVLISFTAFIMCDTFLLSSGVKVVDEPNKTEPTTQVVEVISNDEQYKDANIEINIKRDRQYNTEIYIADVKIKNIEYFKTAFAKDTYGKNIAEFTSDTAKNKNALLAINGDYYGVQEKGYVLKNYVIYRDTPRGKEDLAIHKDGSFEFFNDKEVKLSELEDVKEVFCFGPSLVHNGIINVSKNSKVPRELVSNPRTAIAMIEPLHYLFVVSDGRTNKSEGLSLYQLAKVLESYGVSEAYNLDGGGSSTLYFNGKVVNNPINKHKLVERKVSDIVYIGY